jgi:hypothetical protein
VPHTRAEKQTVVHIGRDVDPGRKQFVGVEGFPAGVEALLFQVDDDAFHISARSDDGGDSLWEQKTGWIEGKEDHGKAMSRSAIV